MDASYLLSYNQRLNQHQENSINHQIRLTNQLQVPELEIHGTYAVGEVENGIREINITGQRITDVVQIVWLHTVYETAIDLIQQVLVGLFYYGPIRCFAPQFALKYARPSGPQLGFPGDFIGKYYYMMFKGERVFKRTYTKRI